MKSIGNDRLEILENFLYNLVETREAQFSMNVWYVKEECGFAACALGYACLIPEFNELGLHLDESDSFPRFQPKLNGILFDETTASLETAEKFFDLSNAEARWLFIPGAYKADHFTKITPVMVADRIKALRNHSRARRWVSTKTGVVV
jgi:hypothetical protein